MTPNKPTWSIDAIGFFITGAAVTAVGILTLLNLFGVQAMRGAGL